MAECIRVYKPTEIEFQKLNMFANFVNGLLIEYDEQNDTSFNIKNQLSVEDLLFDAGQNWMYTAVVSTNLLEHGILRSMHALNPADYKFLIESCNTFEDVKRFAEIYVRYVTEKTVKTPLYKAFTP